MRQPADGHRAHGGCRNHAGNLHAILAATAFADTRNLSGGFPAPVDDQPARSADSGTFKAIVQLDGDIADAELTAHLCERLAPYKLPRPVAAASSVGLRLTPGAAS